MLDSYVPHFGTGALMLAGAGLCLALYRLRVRAKVLSSMQASSQWPITARELVTPEEHDVWQWLRTAFADHYVMLKIPIVRYTVPTIAAESATWHKRLSGVYCSFTVCGPDGTVIGCVDVAGPNAASRTHVYLKESILGKCGIPYAMVRSGKLPSSEEVRAAFIGKIELTEINPAQPAASDALTTATEVSLDTLPGQVTDASVIAGARNALQSSLEARRKTRNTSGPLFDAALDDAVPGLLSQLRH